MSARFAQSGALGILGGGQLGRMLALAAARLGRDVHIYCPDRDAPAARVAARCWAAPFDNTGALADFARNCSAVTAEFENIPLQALEAVRDAGTQIHPSSRSFAVGADRLEEKKAFSAIGLQTAVHVAVDSENDAIAAFDQIGRGFLKTRHSGYDGKGQLTVTSAGEASRAWRRLGNTAMIYEGQVDFVGEMSVLVCRGADGRIAVYDPPRNTHRKGVLITSQVPSGFGSQIETAAISAARRLADELDHVGVLALEYFVCADGALIANEMAPRVHNSGHWTEEACVTGQFEQHVRAVTGLPLGSVRRLGAARMDNITGADALTALNHADPHTRVRLYGKRDARPGRKMGHTVQVER